MNRFYNTLNKETDKIMIKKNTDPKHIRKIAHIAMHEQCLLLRPLGLKSWNLDKAAKAYKELLKKVHAKDSAKGFKLLIHLVLVDSGTNCVDVHEEILKGRWVKLGYTVYCKKV